MGTNHLFEEDGTAYFAEKILPHENYTATGMHDHDIALIKVIWHCNYYFNINNKEKEHISRFQKK